MKPHYFSIFGWILSSLLIQSCTGLSFLCTGNLTTDNLNCDIEKGDFSSKNQTVTTTLKIIEYNIDRNAYGGDSPYERGLDNIISLMNGTDSPLPTPDVLIMSELARDCKEYGNYMDGPKEVAQKLGYYYAYAVEYLEVTNETDHQCTIGNGIFSKYPLSNIGQLRFENQCCKFDGRWGGRVAVYGELNVENKGSVLFYSTHLESGQGDVVDVVDSLVVRVEQIRELIAHAVSLKPNFTIISGDFNAPFGDLDSVNLEMMLNNYEDSHSALSYFDRNTCPFDTLAQYDIFVFDYIFGKSEQKFEFKNPMICNLQYSQQCYGASDHLPIMVDFSLE